MTAVFSPDGLYRYTLTREVDAFASKTMVAFGLLNPSTADEYNNDPTVRRLLRFARRWGYGSIALFNLFAFRATDPRQLRRVADPIGPENDSYIRTLASACDLIVVGWGNHGSYLGRGGEVLRLLEGKQVYCFGKTRSGQPKHPLYLPKSQTLMAL